MRDRQRLEILCDYAADKGYVVDLHAHDHEPDEVDPVTKVITISPAQTDRQKVYALAHELGHVLGYEARDFLFADAEGAIKPGHSARRRLAVVENELDAWRRGWRLCERLGLGLSPRGYELEASTWLMTYCRDAARASTAPAKRR